MAATFTCPSSKLVFERSSFLHEKSRHKANVLQHHFNYGVDLVLPRCDSIPLQLTSILVNSRYFFTQKLPLSAIIDKTFVEAFVKKGKLYMLSYGTAIDREDCAAVVPPGLLILNLTKDTYQELGLNGKPTAFRRKMPTKYVVEIDLTEDQFAPGKKKYERVKWCLTDRLGLMFNFLIAWIPNDDKISPSSVPVYLCNKGFKSKTCKVSEEISFKKCLKCPDVDSSKFDGQPKGANSHSSRGTNNEKFSGGEEGRSRPDALLQVEDGSILCTYTEFWEWLGAVTCGLDSEGSPDGFLSTFSCPEPLSISPSTCVCKYRGFISPGRVSMLVDSVRDYLKASSSPWASVTVHGFTDAPVSWKTNEHGFQIGGENLYTFVLFPNEDYWLYMAVGTNDMCPP